MRSPSTHGREAGAKLLLRESHFTAYILFSLFGQSKHPTIRGTELFGLIYVLGALDWFTGLIVCLFDLIINVSSLIIRAEKGYI